MARKYEVNIVDKDGNLILQFIATVIKKDQDVKGRLGSGPVVETLFTTKMKLLDRRGKTIKINRTK